MKDLLADLIALQDVELEIFKAQEGLRELPKDISEIESIMIARRKSLDAVDEEIASYEQRKTPLEVELKENQAILDAADARIKRIKTNKEFLALQREIDLAKKRKADIEEQILTIMDKIEKKSSERQRIHTSFETDKVILEEKRERLVAQMNDLEAVVAEYQGKDKNLRKIVDPSLLSKYDRIKQGKKGLAVVECAEGVCRGCNMHIQPQLFNELVRGDRLIICPSCQRILFVNQRGGTDED
ncbi:MAG TPA: C4-type zinc ribbon domain-containing protein [Deltaproteobacteria bacterium]|nr:C4-type zinc ribbon domain-containing protein [Deltaproteobacteria bacterium]HPR53973.1 C4-type zinc ribbon domain-containing protein [Deltaproteobacteria bacterium]HXK46404.1 C4-type zinc ribbon domain-containing protein [Deltaproteobacteria bacterium]